MALRSSLEPVMRDVESTFGHLLTLPPSATADTVFELRGPSNELVGLSRIDETPIHQIVRLAEDVQEWILENVSNTWPPCPLHPTHPLWPGVRGSRPVWICTTNDEVFFQIGGLSE